eukprot:TRINITY_DN3629_c0_g1_i5.p2 TRINITY_DN3629_c0_g1~~TRINITY_DN3629_c0_g1_i5.p2  ORF type:complete len:111 (-),score=2.34 TRINITY_DN3629_c0_g1_i5:1045-1377(-)
MAAHSPEMSGRITALVRRDKKFILYIRVNEQKPENHGKWTIQSVNLVYETNDGCKLVSQDRGLAGTPTTSFVLSCGEDGKISMILWTKIRPGCTQRKGFLWGLIICNGCS